LISFGIPINIRFSLFGSYKVNHHEDDLTTSYLFFEMITLSFYLKSSEIASKKFSPLFKS
jgi:hypothetical protein